MLSWVQVSGGANMFADLRYALRQLKRSPGFAVTAALTLAIGIGANAVVFSVLNALVLRPLALPHAEQLFSSSANQPTRPITPIRIIAIFATRIRRSREWPHIASRPPDCLRAKVLLRYGCMRHLGITSMLRRSQPFLGRFFHGSDEHGAGTVPYTVLSYGYWQSHFGGDPGIVGKTIEINKQPLQVIGIAPPTFHGTEMFVAPDLWVPMMNQQQIDGWNYLDARGDHTIFVIGRLKPGVTRGRGGGKSECDCETPGSDVSERRPGPVTSG